MSNGRDSSQRGEHEGSNQERLSITLGAAALNSRKGSDSDNATDVIYRCSDACGYCSAGFGGVIPGIRMLALSFTSLWDAHDLQRKF